MSTSIRVMLNTDRVSVSGYYPLIIRVIHNRRKKLIYSPYRLQKADFDNEKQHVVWTDTSKYSKHKVDEINRTIKVKLQEVEKLLARLEREHRDGFTADDIVIRYQRDTHDSYISSFLDKEIASKRSSGRHGMAEIYTSCRNSLFRFTGSEKVRFKDITYRFITEYIDHLRRRNVCENTIHMYLRNFRAVYNKAKREGLVTAKNHPFDDIRMSGTATIKRALPKDAIRRIANLTLCDKQCLELARDVFLFSFYTRGMSTVDMLNLKHSNISDGNIYYVRNKTGQNIQVAIEPPLQILIDKYRSDSPYVLPFLDEKSEESLYRQYRRALGSINANLKCVGVMASIEKPLTTYVARHSWATIAKTEGVSIATISEGLGHTTEKTTQIYLQAFDHKMIDEANAIIIAL